MKEKSLILSIYTLFSAILMWLTLPNELIHYGNQLLAPIILVPLFYVVTKASGLKAAALYGALFGLFSSSFIYFWLLFFHDFSIWTLSGVVLGHIICFLILFPILSTFSNSPYRPIIYAALWIIYEYLRSIGYLAFPWGLMAHTVGRFYPIIQIADITGQWGVSFLVVLVNAMIFETICGAHRKNNYTFFLKWGFTLFLICSVLAYGAFRLQRPIPVHTTFKALLVQQNADSWVRGQEMESIRIGQELTREGLASAQKPVDLVIWSENSLRYPYDGPQTPQYTRFPEGDTFIDFLFEIDTPLLVGSPYVIDWEQYQAMNAVIIIDPEGKIDGVYGKNRPVPFAEHIPFWEIPQVKKFFQEIVGLGSAGWALGDQDTLLTFSNEAGQEITFGAPICFEDSFADLHRHFIKQGADLFINLTNDAWSGTISAETQHHAAAQFRSIETRRTMVRSTNAGVTSMIDPFGRSHYTLPLFYASYALIDVPVYRESTYTTYTKLGDYFPVTLLVILFIYHISIYMKKIKEKQQLF